MKIYVTGVAGFLGSHIAERLSKDHEVAGCDNLSGGDIRNIPNNVLFHEMDCADRGGLLEVFKGVDVVYHCAAHAHEGLSVFSPFTVCRSIYESSVSVFSAAIASGVKRIVHCSSMSRYGDGATPFHENQPPRPKDPYAIAKVAAEETLKALAETHGIEYVIAVPHNIVGPRQKYDDPFRNVVAIMANRLLLGLQPIVYGDGSQTRCFSDIRDVAPILCEFATKQGISGQTFNVGPDEQIISILELSRMMCDITCAEWNPLFLPDRPREVPHAFCSSNKIRQWFGYKTQHSLRSTLTSLVDYVLRRGAKEFSYYLPVEIVNEKTPKFWTKEVR